MTTGVEAETARSGGTGKAAGQLEQGETVGRRTARRKGKHLEDGKVQGEIVVFVEMSKVVALFTRTQHLSDPPLHPPIKHESSNSALSY